MSLVDPIVQQAFVKKHPEFETLVMLANHLAALERKVIETQNYNEKTVNCSGKRLPRVKALQAAFRGMEFQVLALEKSVGSTGVLRRDVGDLASSAFPLLRSLLCSVAELIVVECEGYSVPRRIAAHDQKLAELRRCIHPTLQHLQQKIADM